jgi:short-subunit dehydrogenase
MRPTALITGASSGIGEDLATLFARDGHDLVLTARSETKLHATAAKLEKEFGIKATVIVADLARAEAPQEIADALKAKGIEIDALVNNAGFGVVGPFVETDLEAELGIIQVNVVALTHLTKLLLPGMVARKRGRILNIASTAAFQPGPLMAVYYATKAYVLSFSQAIADELRDTGVTVTALCPGPTATGFAAAADMGNTRLFTLMRPMSSATVAKIGYRAMKHGRRVVTAGIVNKVMGQAVRITPRRLLTTIVRKLQESKG